MNTNSRAIRDREAIVEDVDWEAVYRDLLPKVYHFFCFQIGDIDIAEDLTSSTFERAWHGRMRFRRRLGGFSGWVFGIAKNVFVDYVRSKRDKVSINNINLPSKNESLESGVERRNDYERLSLLLMQLNERERTLISLKYGAGFTNREISKLTDLSESNVGTILHRVITRLRDNWENQP
jgi:RNA polymerase sigma-70 factor (ECF subfamily)